MKTKLTLSFFTALLSLVVTSFSAAQPINEHIRYELAISFDMEKHMVYGTAHLVLPAGSDITLFLDEITATGILLKDPAARPAAITSEGLLQLDIPASDRPQEVFISYEKQVDGRGDNFISSEGIALLNDWLPLPSKRVFFTLEAAVPRGFTALSETDLLDNKPSSGGTASFSLGKPAETIHFIAAPYAVDRLKVREGLEVYSYFLPEDRQLAPGYLEAARAFLLRYEEMIGPYPYKHFVIAENLRPTGYGMPTLTLLGKYVLRLPFIKDTSLGHEILHSWFGNSIDVDYRQGNWSEGLTSYLADWLYREDAGEDALNRKEQLLKYQSYVNADSAIPLQSFLSAAHNQPLAEAVRSVGYTKGAMLFHELRRLVGDELFFQAIRKFYSRFRDGIAGWTDLEQVFTEVSGKNLARFFQERLVRKDIIDLDISDIAINTSTPGTTLTVTVNQKTEEPYQLMLPIRVESTNRIQEFTREVTEASEEIVLPLQSLPTRIIIDPEYDLMRTLEENEDAPTLSRFLGPQETLVIADQDLAKHGSSLVEYAGEHHWQLFSTEKSEAPVAGNNIVLPGRSNSTARSLFGPSRHPSRGATFEVRKHPLNSKKTILLISFSDEDELKRALPKLRHYGKYSYLHFKDGRIQDKRFSPGMMGYGIPLSREPEALPVREVMSFNDAMDKIRTADVVYLGESHTAMQDHHLQYLTIERLFLEGENFAIGMEMFPSSSQASLDEYTLGENPPDEKTFLKRSHYFQVWKFDYRYYKKIIDFARKHKIPIVGLNIDKKIVSSIYRNNSTSGLSEEQKKLLPKERDLSLPGYAARLQAVYGQHSPGGDGQSGLAGFIQAQGVWDEVMAENISLYLKENPGEKMVVLAGSGHTRKDSGIPPRVKRRANLNQMVIMTAKAHALPSPELADFFFYLEEMQLAPAGKIGISIEERQKSAGQTALEIVKIHSESEARKAGLRVGDGIVSIDSFPVKSMEDVQIALAGKEAGDDITMVVRRPAGATGKEKALNITLYDPNRKMDK